MLQSGLIQWCAITKHIALLLHCFRERVQPEEEQDQDDDDDDGEEE